MLQRIETGLAQGTCVRGAQQDTPKAVVLNPGLAYVKLKKFELQLLLYLTINIYKYLEIKYLEGWNGTYAEENSINIFLIL